MWENPVYRFRIPEQENQEKLKEVLIDVTGSAPPFKEPSDALKEILDELFSSDSFKKIENVLEFGAAKLKNIPYILKKGKTVCAIEFKELTKNSFTKQNLKICEGFGDKFQKMIFPSPFIPDKKKFDLGLLLNVPPVMPIFAERMYLIDLLYDKIKKGKYLLWVAQKEGSYKKIREEGKNACGDGIWMGKGRKFKTFYKYHRIEDLDEMMSLYGFKLVKRFSVGDDARLYEKTNHNLFNKLITKDKIEKLIPHDKTIKDPTDTKDKIVKKSSKIKVIIPNPKELLIENLYKEKITSLNVGPENAELFHRLISHAFARIFRGSLRNMEIKVNVDDGIKIIDTVFTNSAKDGFFHNLRSKVECSYPMIEVKSISGDPTNVELDQLNGRLNQNRGHFGILICRDVKDKDRVRKRCKTYLPNNYVLFLTDEDIFELLDYSKENSKEDISDFMDKKLRDILF